MVETLGVKLLPVGETAGHRIAADIDDPRIGQDQPDQAEMHPVVGHLVGELGPVGAAMDAAGVEIASRQGRATGRRGERQDAFERPLCRAAASSPSWRTRLGMSVSSAVPSIAGWLARICSTRVDPERCMPTMKIGSRAGRALAGAGGEEGGREEGDAAVDPIADHRRIVGRDGGAQAIALGIMVERGRRLAAILMRLAEREIEPDAVLHRHLGRRQRLLHRRRCQHRRSGSS